tara:strand:- start:174 stop:557 length:384 start_codon:yes stop_codon:yes gene_type:complete
MRTLIILLFISFLLISCSKKVDELITGFQPTVFELKLRYDGDELTFTQIFVSDAVFNVTSNNQSFEYATYWEVTDVKVLLIYDCETEQKENLNKEVLVNFYDDKITVLEISSVANCNPEVKVLYEDK